MPHLFQSDVWSYGVTLYELFSLGKTPYENWLVLDQDAFNRRIDDGERLPKPKECTQEM